jgi:cytochrome c-type biogenesis protein CcmH/NrfG
MDLVLSRPLPGAELAFLVVIAAVSIVVVGIWAWVKSDKQAGDGAKDDSKDGGT